MENFGKEFGAFIIAVDMEASQVHNCSTQLNSLQPVPAGHYAQCRTPDIGTLTLVYPINNSLPGYYRRND